MITEIEEQFFEVFGIEPKYNIYTKEWLIPQITDRIYLMLLATLTCISSIEFPFSDLQKLKEDILKEVIKHSYGFDKHQVQTLFKENN